MSLKILTKEEQAAIETARSNAWFALKVALCMLAVHYAFGTMVSIAFLAGWLWGERKKDEPSDVTKLDDLL